MTDCVYYERVLREACNQLLLAVVSDYKFVHSHPIPNRIAAFDKLADNYIKYIQIANKFNTCNKEMKLPLLRTGMKKLWELVTGRILEIKHEMVQIEQSDYQYLDNLIINNNLTRWDMELVIPDCKREQRKEQLEDLNRRYDRIVADQERKRLEEALARGELDNVDDIVIVGRLSELSDIVGESSMFSRQSSRSPTLTASAMEKKRAMKAKEPTPEDLERIAIIKLIQRHERARVVKLQIQLAREHERLKADIDDLVYKPIPIEKKMEVALILQRHWNEYKKRRTAKYISDQKRLLLDLYVPSYRDLSHIPKLNRLIEERRKHQNDLISAMQDVVFVYKLRMERKKEIMQGDLILELMKYVKDWYWITKMYKATPNFPEWPDSKKKRPPYGFLGFPKKMPIDFIEEQQLHKYDMVNQLFGHDFQPLVGSEFITAGHWVPAGLWAEVKNALDEYKAAKKKKKRKKSKKKTKTKKITIKELSKLGHVPRKSRYVDELLISAREAWYDYCENDFKYSKKEEDSWEIEAEVDQQLYRSIRMEADEKIREHIENLKSRIKKKRRKSKKKRKEKGTSETKETGEEGQSKETTEMGNTQLYELLAKNNMIRKYDKINIKDLAGEYSFKNFELRRIYKEDPPASLGDIYQVIKEYCILPLINCHLRKRSPLIQSVLFIGPNCYTHPIVDAICTEAGAVLFYINPLEAADKFPPESFQELFFKVPKLFEPAVIHLDGAEKPYYKRVPFSEAINEPRSLARILPKIVGSIQKRDQILFIGTSEKPWEAASKKMLKIFAKVIPIPDLDYFTLSKYWRTSLMKYHGVARSFSYQTLASLSQATGLSGVDIERAVTELMTIPKILLLQPKPLKLEEFETLLTTPRFNRSYWTWAQDHVPLFKSRKKMLKKAAKKEKLEKAKEKEKSKKYMR